MQSNGNRYDHASIEQKWQEKWKEDGIYTVHDSVPGKDNYYTLVEFSYPSGNLHVGHWYAFSVTDIFARYKRMQGFNVLYPMGFDAFGLPAENAAIKLGADPKVWTYEQMEKMRVQLRSMGAMFDWNREVVTCDPTYFKWTQWMFNQFLKHDLVYRDVTSVNWCPKDQTILANEQVVDGKCERCGTEVEQRNQEQWMLRITKYADRLVDDLDKLAWPEEIKAAQRNWIGRSVGSEITFNLSTNDEITVFTTRADTLFGVTYVVLAPEHTLVQKLLSHIENKEEVLVYIDATKKKLELERQQSKEKTGVQLVGITAVNPANGEHVPVWIADYVLAGYGTGAVMAVPAHDDRDLEFANKYHLKKRAVVVPPFYADEKFTTLYDEYVEKLNSGLECYTDDGVLVNSKEFNTLSSEEARAKITDFVKGKKVKTYRLRDWGISRQRYWGCPIPIVYDPDGKPHAVPDEHLPWLLPTDVDHTPSGIAPLAKSKELFERTERIFGKGWKPEVETMDTFVDSTWYFYRYLDNKNNEIFADPQQLDAWMPIDLYMGGAEHTTMHVLYSRFWTKALFDLGYVKDDEAYTIRRNRGLILAPDGSKMSKSKGNAVSPDEVVEQLGADTVRMYLGFMGPYGVTINYPWDPNGVVGVRRFLERVWRLKEKTSVQPSTQATLLHQTIKKMSHDIEDYKFNTATAAMMILINAWEKEESVSVDEYKTLLRLLAPFAPHMTEELWYMFGETESVHLAAWPTYDESLTIEDEVTLGVQINGKVRAQITVPTGASEAEVQEIALAHPRVIQYLEGNTPKKVIVVPNRIINIVL